VYAGGASSGMDGSIVSGTGAGTEDLEMEDSAGRLGGGPDGEANDCELGPAVPAGSLGASNGFELEAAPPFSGGGFFGGSNGLDMSQVVSVIGESSAKEQSSTIQFDRRHQVAQSLGTVCRGHKPPPIQCDDV
jgi:hypothetical protein